LLNFFYLLDISISIHYTNDGKSTGSGMRQLLHPDLCS
jgi:hypothetical protein